MSATIIRFPVERTSKGKLEAAMAEYERAHKAWRESLNAADAITTTNEELTP